VKAARPAPFSGLAHFKLQALRSVAFVISRSASSGAPAFLDNLAKQREV